MSYYTPVKGKDTLKYDVNGKPYYVHTELDGSLSLITQPAEQKKEFIPITEEMVQGFNRQLRKEAVDAGVIPDTVIPVANGKDYDAYLEKMRQINEASNPSSGIPWVLLLGIGLIGVLVVTR